MERLRKGLSIFAAAALLAPASGALAGRPVFQRHHENHEGDDDRGGKPTKTTVSDLTLRSRALLGKDGKTQLEISTAPFDTAGTPPGNISHVHVRAVDPNRADRDGDDDDKDGKEGKERRFRREYNHLRGGGYFTNYPSDPWTGLPHGQNLRIEAKARGTVHRDELEARWLDTIRYRPDLYVKMIVAPAQARINTVVTIDGIIGEGMGETGADTDCVLLVDGAQVDSGLLWVNAGDAATCEFHYAFPNAGLHTISVRAQNVRPDDYDDSNNTSAPKQILITQPFFAHYDATVSETTKISNKSVDTYLISASATPNQEQKTFSTTVDQLRSFLGLLPGDVNPETVRVSFKDSSGGRDLSSFDLSGLTIGAPEASELPGCSTTRSVMDVDATTGRCVTVSRCTAASGTNSTSVFINYPATQVTTFSRNICRTSNIGCKVGDFVTAPQVTSDHPLVQLADDYSAAVEVEDAATGKFTAKPTMALAPFVLVPLNSVTLQPCRPFNGKGKQCTTVTSNVYGKAGTASKDNAE